MGGKRKRHQNPPLPLSKTPARKHTRTPHQDIDSTFHLPSLFFQRFQGQQSQVGGRTEGEERPQEDLEACDLQWLRILGVRFVVWRAGVQIVSLLPRTEWLGALERGRHRAGGAEGSGSF